jgi:hypothetical protein
MEFELATAKQILERTPATLVSLLVGLSDDWLDATEGPDTWSRRQVVHDLNHLMQIERTMAKQYAAAVRPWRAYLRILH